MGLGGVTSRLTKRTTTGVNIQHSKNRSGEPQRLRLKRREQAQRHRRQNRSDVRPERHRRVALSEQTR